jgi:hypothetical protein
VATLLHFEWGGVNLEQNFRVREEAFKLTLHPYTPGLMNANNSRMCSTKFFCEENISLEKTTFVAILGKQFKVFGHIGFDVIY